MAKVDLPARRAPDRTEFILETALALLPRIMTPAHVRERFSCIRTHRLLFDVFRHFKLRVTPWPCRLTVFNPAAAVLAEAWGREPVTEAEMEEWLAAGGFYLTIGMPEAQPDRFNGHLVLKVGEPQATTEHWLVDGSIQQCHRPNRGIHLDQPLMVPIPEEFQGEDRWSLTGPGGILLYLVGDPTLTDREGRLYHELPGWQRRPDWDRWTHWLIRQIMTAEQGAKEKKKDGRSGDVG